MVQSKVKSRAKMANTAFANEFTTPCKLVPSLPLISSSFPRLCTKFAPNKFV